MTTQPPSDRRTRHALLRQLPEDLKKQYADISTSALALERDADRGCMVVTEEYREHLEEMVSACLQFVTTLMLLNDIVRYEMAVQQCDDCFDVEMPCEGWEFGETYASIYHAADAFDARSVDWSQSPCEEDRRQAPLLWECGTLCDRMLAHLGSLRGDGATIADVRQRPDWPTVEVKVVNIDYSGATLTFEAGSTQNGDIHHHQS